MQGRNWNPGRLGIRNKLHHPQSCHQIKVKSEKITLVVYGVRAMALKGNTRNYLHKKSRHPEVQKIMVVFDQKCTKTDIAMSIDLNI